ncbi:MAG: ArnT family glycosyltransferase [Devosia sp.]
MTSISATENGARATPAAQGSVRLLQLAVAYFLALKLAYGVTVPPDGDAGYYWLWGGHPQLSYFDHSPLVGWTSGISRLLFGWTPLGLQFPAMVTFLVLAFALHRAARWLAPENAERHFWLTLAIFCASPLLYALTTLNYPDHLLICFSTLALLLIGRYLNGAISHAERHADLYLGAAFLGFAGLSKYNAVFIPAGLLVVLIADRRFRRLFRSPHLYLAGALCFAITLPVLIWNAQNHFASVELHTAERLNSYDDPFTPLMLVRLLAVSALMFSPFLIVPLCRFMFGRAARPEQGGIIQIARGTALVSTLVLLPLSTWAALGRQVYPHWMVLSFLPFLLVAPFYLRSRWLIRLHLGWGVAINTLAVIYLVLAPLPTTLLGIEDREASRTFGREQVAAEVDRLAAEHGITHIGGDSYVALSRLAFGRGSDANLTDFGGRIDRLTQVQLTPGEDLLLLGDPEDFAAHFDSIEPLTTITPRRFGLPLDSQQILLGRGYRP